MNKFQQIPIGQIIIKSEISEPLDSDLELLKSIEEQGMVNPLLVRDITKAGDTKKNYELIDGQRRLKCCKELCIKQVMCQVATITDLELIEAQIIESRHHVPTDPKQYALALRHVLKNNRELTLAEFAKRLGKSEKWLYERIFEPRTKVKINTIKGPIASDWNDVALRSRLSTGVGIVASVSNSHGLVFTVQHVSKAEHPVSSYEGHELELIHEQ